MFEGGGVEWKYGINVHHACAHVHACDDDGTLKCTIELTWNSIRELIHLP